MLPLRATGTPDLIREAVATRRPGIVDARLPTTRTLDSHASRLGRKLSAAGEHWIVNVRGVGYRLL